MPQHRFPHSLEVLACLVCASALSGASGDAVYPEWYRPPQLFVMTGFIANTTSGTWGPDFTGSGLWSPEKQQQDLAKWNKGLGAAYDPKKTARAFKEAGATGVIFYDKWHDGIVPHRTKLTSFMTERDLVGDTISALRKQGLKIVIYYSVGFDHNPDPKFKDWVCLDASGKPMGRPFPADWMSFHSPYRQYVIGHLLEITKQYGPIDGLWLDIFGQPQPSYDRYSQEAFTKKYGKALEKATPAELDAFSAETLRDFLSDIKTSRARGPAEHELHLQRCGNGGGDGADAGGTSGRAGGLLLHGRAPVAQHRPRGAHRTRHGPAVRGRDPVQLVVVRPDDRQGAATGDVSGRNSGLGGDRLYPGSQRLRGDGARATAASTTRVPICGDCGPPGRGCRKIASGSPAPSRSPRSASWEDNPRRSSPRCRRSRTCGSRFPSTRPPSTVPGRRWTSRCVRRATSLSRCRPASQPGRPTFAVSAGGAPRECAGRYGAGGEHPAVRTGGRQSAGLRTCIAAGRDGAAEGEVPARRRVRGRVRGAARGVQAVRGGRRHRRIAAAQYAFVGCAADDREGAGDVGERERLAGDSSRTSSVRGE